MKKRFTDEQIILMIKEQEAGEKTAASGGRVVFYRLIDQRCGTNPDAVMMHLCEMQSSKFPGSVGGLDIVVST